MRHWNADLANFTARQDVIGVVPGLGRKVERNGQARLTFRQVHSIERIGFLSRTVTGIGAHHPWLIAHQVSPAVW